MLRAGEFRHRVTLQKPGTREDDSNGGGSIPYTDVADVWARIRPLSGSELFDAARSNPKISIEVGIRYYPGIKASWRVKYGARLFDIKSPPVNVDERNREILLMCEELPAP